MAGNALSDQDAGQGAGLAGAARDADLALVGVHDGALGEDVAAHVVDVGRVLRHRLDGGLGGRLGLGVRDVDGVGGQELDLLGGAAAADELLGVRAQLGLGVLGGDLEAELLAGADEAAAGGLAGGEALPEGHQGTGK